VGKLVKNTIADGISLSSIALGTMRFRDKGLEKEELVDMMKYLYHELGVNTHHSSYEYNSYELYCQALTEFKKDSGVQLHHICKLSSPDFWEENFSKLSLKEKIHNELKSLKTERISVLQWLFRTEPINDEKRIPALHRSLHEIDEAFTEFIKEGIVGVVGTFPYSIAFGEEVSEYVTTNTGWISYHNFAEREYLDNLPSNQWMIGIRPLAAGKVVNSPQGEGGSQSVREALAFCFSDTRVKSNIMSINSMARAQQLQRIIATE
jgi:aryl-alcohol dehydrogenase-like predicted oxidoreductase